MRQIVFYCHSFYPQESGYSHAFQNLIKAVAYYYPNLNLKVITPEVLNDKHEINFGENVKIIRLPKVANFPPKLRYIINNFFYAKKTIQYLKKADFLFVETFDSFFFLQNIPKKFYKKIGIRIHATMETEYAVFRKGIEDKLRKFFISHFISRKVRWIFSTNKYHIDFFKKFYLDNNLFEIAEKHFFVLPNTLGPEQEKIFEDISMVNTGKRKYMKLLLLGRLDEAGWNQKGFLDFILAWYLIPPEVRNKFEVTIIGKGSMFTILQKIITNLKLKIKLIPQISHVKLLNLLRTTDIVVLPSRYEGLSMFALEALAAGNICLFSKTGGLIDLIENGKNGFLFKPQDLDDLILKLRILASMGDNKILEMKENSKRVYKNKFHSSKVAEKFIRYLSIIEAYNKAFV